MFLRIVLFLFLIFFGCFVGDSDYRRRKGFRGLYLGLVRAGWVVFFYKLFEYLFKKGVGWGTDGDTFFMWFFVVCRVYSGLGIGLVLE